MATEKKTVIILRESVIGSWAKDIVTFGMFVGTMYFNHKVLDGNGWIDAIMLLLVIMWLSGLKSSQVFRGNRTDAVAWLQERERNDDNV